MPSTQKSVTTGITIRLPGIVLTLTLAAMAAMLGARFPIVGGAVFGIVFGLLVRATGQVGPAFRPGIAFSARQVLQASIILLGASLSLKEIISTGASSLAVMLGTLVTCLVAAWIVGKLFRIAPDLNILIGVGTAICGASAIAAVSPVIEAEEQDVAYAISTIFLFNMAAVLVFPAIGHWLGLDQHAFGLWAGTAINDTSSVVAAAYGYGHEAGTYATVVKLTRSTIIIPIALGLAFFRGIQARRAAASAADAARATDAAGAGAAADVAATANGGGGGAVGTVSLHRLVPWFIIWFLVAALVNTLGILPAAFGAAAAHIAKLLIVMALTAVGLSADFRQIARTGFKPIVLGLVLWAVVAVTGLGVQGLTGQL